ncbi:MAG: NaeI family type II restriction endonuclease [Solirubrobacterales bacterium]
MRFLTVHAPAAGDSSSSRRPRRPTSGRRSRSSGDPLELERGPVLDLEIEGVPVDLKWPGSQQIPIEALGEICLCIGGLKNMTQFQVGVVRCNEDHLNTGQNRDGKRTLSEAGRSALVHLVDPTALPPNFVAEMDPGLRAEIVALPTRCRRGSPHFGLLYTAIPRNAVTTIARIDGGSDAADAS